MKNLFLCIFVLLCLQSVAVAEFPPPKFIATDSMIGEFIVENYYTFPVYIYDQVVPDIGIEDSSYSTPEDAFISLINSMSKLDKDWFFNSWDATSKVDVMKDFNDPSVADELIPAWERTFTGATVTIVKRVDVGEFIIIDSLVEKDGTSFKLAHRFVFEDNKWVVTRKYLANPVFRYYLSGKNKVRLPPN